MVTLFKKVYDIIKKKKTVRRFIIYKLSFLGSKQILLCQFCTLVSKNGNCFI